MKFLRLFLRYETVAPVVALMMATAVCLLLVGLRIVSANGLHDGFRRHAGLIWNLFLAWLPLVFALLAGEEWRRGTKRNWRFVAFATGWLLFAPNAPYIFTDVVHISVIFTKHYWVDLMMILSCGLTGLMLWFLALYLMHAMVTKRFGGVAGWIFVLAEAALSGIGIYLGRFARLNSWDAVTKPGEVYHGVSAWMSSAMGDKPTVAFAGFFAAFLFIAYVMFYALTHLTPPKSPASTAMVQD